MSFRTYRGVAVVMAVLVWLSPPAHAAQSARTMYTSALAREQAARSALARGQQVTRVQLVQIVTIYERIVRNYPASGYGDNALWQASGLALTAFERFGNPRDRRTAVRLLRDLRARYVSSSLMPKVREQLVRLETTPSAQTVQRTAVATGSSSPLALRVASPVVPTSRAIRAADPRASTGERTRTGTMHSIQRIVMPDLVRVVLHVDQEVSYRDERLPSPSRMFLDLAAARPSASLADVVLRYDSDVVRQIRVGRHPNSVTRVVLDFDGIVGYSIYPMYNPYRLVIDCERATTLAPQSRPLMAAAFDARSPGVLPGIAPVDTAPPELTGQARRVREISKAPAAVSAPLPGPAPVVPAGPLPTPPAPRVITRSKPPAEATPATAVTRAPMAEPPVETPIPPVPAVPAPADTTLPPTVPSANLRGGFSLARQLGLGISRIVIDPGHGGHDPGASGRGVTEAELVLDVALKLEQRLLKLPGVEVILTRRSNVYVPLDERTAIANREGSDLFLSIHANASRNERARGVETYFLNFASSSEAAAVAARENSASGANMNSLPDIVRAIALNNKVDESRDFATYVQRSMTDRLRPHNKDLRDLGVKQAPFVVLIGAAMPSVLAEVSFVTNRQEAQLLRGAAYRQRIADALFEGVTRYQRALKRAPTVASGEMGTAKR